MMVFGQADMGMHPSFATPFLWGFLNFSESFFFPSGSRENDHYEQLSVPWKRLGLLKRFIGMQLLQ